MDRQKLRALAEGLSPPDLGPQVRLRDRVSRVRMGLVRRRRRQRRPSDADGAPASGLTPARAPDAALGILRPGFNNFGPSAAFVFAFARRQERTVLAYACDGEGPRLADDAGGVDGAPVPDDLRGRIVVVGSPDWCVLSLEAASDLFLRQVHAVAEAAGRRALDGLGADAVVAGQARFLGHSQGGLEGLLDRARLQAAGLPDLLGTVVGVAPPCAGAPVMRGPRAAALLARGAAAAAGPEGARAVEVLASGGPERVLARHGTSPAAFDRVLAGQLRRGGSAFFRSLGFLLAGGAAGWAERSDGLVSTESSRHGVPEGRFVLFDGDADHDLLFEDPRVVSAALGPP